MFKILANPTFDATLTIVGQGREQKLSGTFKHMIRDDYMALLQAIADGKMDVADAVVSLFDKWDADMPLTAESVKTLQQHQPGADWAIITGYGEALAVARKGN